MIHGADPWWDTAIRLMLKYRNLRLMTSAWSPKRLPASLLHYMSTRGKDRILFASDYPVLSMQRCLGEAAALDLTDEVRRAWLYDNAHAFFFDGDSAVTESADRRQAQEPRPREKPQQIADELRALIVSGELSEGDSLGHEPDLVERFGVSRPSLREALRILETEGLVTVVRGVHGGVVVHAPDERMTARHRRTGAPGAQRRARRRLRGAKPPRADRGARDRDQPRAAGRGQGAARPDHARRRTPSRTRSEFGVANAAFHQRLVSLAGNQTLTHRRRDAQRDRRPRGDGGEPRRRRASGRCRCDGAGCARRTGCSTSSKRATARPPKSTGARTCRSSGA